MKTRPKTVLMIPLATLPAVAFLILAGLLGCSSSSNGDKLARSEATMAAISSSGGTTGSTSSAAVIATTVGLGCGYNTCIWINGSNFSTSCSVNVYSASGTTQIATVTAPAANCQSTVFTFAIPAGIQPGNASIQLSVVNLETGVASNKLSIQIQKASAQSKLGLHIIGAGSDPDTAAVQATCPAVTKFLLPDSTLTNQIQGYKNLCPRGITVLRAYVSSASATYTSSQSATADAENFWGLMLAQGVPATNPAPPYEFDWLEGPNELDNIPDWYGNATNAAWLATFWSELADLMHAAGYRPLVGSIAAGAPYPATLFGSIADTMNSKSYPWGWSYHAYTNHTATENVATETPYTLGYRAIRDQNGLNGIPIVLSEGGAQWQGWLTDSYYLAWLEWLDFELQKDPEVVGLTVWEEGDPAQYPLDDLAPIAVSLSDYFMAGHSPVSAANPPAAGEYQFGGNNYWYDGPSLNGFCYEGPSTSTWYPYFDLEGILGFGVGPKGGTVCSGKPPANYYQFDGVCYFYNGSTSNRYCQCPNECPSRSYVWGVVDPATISGAKNDGICSNHC
jgi:hypothetical protein